MYKCKFFDALIFPWNKDKYDTRKEIKLSFVLYEEIKKIVCETNAESMCLLHASTYDGILLFFL